MSTIITSTAESEKDILRPRGTRVMLPHGGLPEVYPPYLADLIARTGGPDGPIGRQFISQPEKERKHVGDGMSDPFFEDQHEVAPGLIYKFEGRALWTITRYCAAYCRFCMRGREVGMSAGIERKSNAALAHTPHLLMDQIDETLSFIEKQPGLNEIILSGGDPLTVNPKTLHYILGKLGTLQQTGKLQIVRIGTRVPVHNPFILRQDHYEAIKQLRNPRMMVHINHPLELTPQTLNVLEKFRRECGGIVMSQTVLLRGVNDSVEVLYELFTKLTAEGVVPYYVFQNDAVYWAKHFTVPLPKAIKLWQKLRPMLSGVAATARFTIDVAKGYGKIPLPEGDAWEVDYSKGFKDFHGKRFSMNYAKGK